jgi:polyisoprenyl-teichoic acid--peptidoglycan teichoic acid transferase
VAAGASRCLYLVRVSPDPPNIPGISDWRPLARGGFATVWEARQETLDRLVAVKVDERTLDSESEQRRFLGEARAAGNLSGHPGIVTVHDAGILADGRPYLVMKLCPGGSLTRWLQSDHRQSPEQIRTVGVRIADALAAAHAQGMLHRDVKPANILIDAYGHAGLADFGLATTAEPGSADGMTPAYAPPEAIRGESATEFGDVYQLAATLYALLSGRPPRESIGGRLPATELIDRLDAPVDPLPGVDEGLMRVVLAGLSATPTDRPTAAEFRDRLAAVDLTGGAQAASGVGAGAEASKPRRRRRLALTLVVTTILCLLVVVIGGSGVYLYEIDRSVTANISRGIDIPEAGPGGVQRPARKQPVDRTLDYVLIGTDDGDPELDRQGRSDSIMLVHLNQARDQAYVISIPRDTLVTIPGHGEDRINAAYALGGAALVVRTLETLTGARMDHVAMIDFQGFVNLTEDLGGITVKNRRAFTSHGQTFPAGEINLSGDTALWYVRERNATMSELDRAENQRNVLKAILSKGLSAEVVSDPLRFTRFVGSAAKRMRVDNAFTNSELRSTALSLRLRSSDINMLSAPLGPVRKVDGRPVRSLDVDRLAEFRRALSTDTMAAYVAKYPRG